MDQAVTASTLENLTPELQALIQGIRGEAPTPCDIDWEHLKALAMVHGIAPLLHKAWRDLSNIVLPAVLNDFKYARRQSALNGTLGLRQRDEVLGILQQAGIRSLVLKGAALGQIWYRDLSLRPFIDIDLLLPADEIGRAQELLLRAGYADGPDWEATHHERPLYRAGMPCVVELHHELTRLTQLPPLRFEDLYHRSITVDGTDAGVRTLGPEDTLLHLCLHLLAHLEQDHGWKLRYFCDIARHVEAFDIDWLLLNALAASVNARRGCAAVLGLTELVTRTLCPSLEEEIQIVHALLRHPVPGEIEHRFLAAFLEALRQLDLVQASSLLLRPMALNNPKSRFRLGQFRPYRLLPIVARLLRETATRPSQLRGQVRIWLPHSGKWDERERLLAELLNSPKSHGQ